MSMFTVNAGSDVTVVGYGAQLQILRQACDMAREVLGVSCELIDLRTILPWDEDTVIKVKTRLYTCDNLHVHEWHCVDKTVKNYFLCSWILISILCILNLIYIHLQSNTT